MGVRKVRLALKNGNKSVRQGKPIRLQGSSPKLQGGSRIKLQ